MMEEDQGEIVLSDDEGGREKGEGGREDDEREGGKQKRKSRGELLIRWRALNRVCDRLSDAHVGCS